MDPFRIFAYRASQAFVKRLALPFSNIHPAPKLEGDGSLLALPSWLREHRYHHPFVVLYSENALKQPSVSSFLKTLEKASYKPFIYTGTKPDPTYALAVSVAEKIIKANCDVIIAIGGGSAMDLAKASSLIASNGRWEYGALYGNEKAKKRPIDLIPVPTTAGSGSETTPSSVLLDDKANLKRAINDPKLIPTLAVLDPNLLKTLSPKMIAEPGMDALTHAVEAIIGRYVTRKTRSYSIQASRLIIDSLPILYADHNDKKAAQDLENAAYLAGFAFSRSFVGYSHALSHALGGLYGIPHGRLNAILLPKVLEAYGRKVHKPLARLAEASSLTPLSASREEKAKAYIEKLRELSLSLGIPPDLKGMTKKEDIPLLAKRAAKEANPFYPVPRILSWKDLAHLLEELS